MISAGVVVEAGAEIHDSIIMKNSVIKAGAKVYKAIVAEDVEIGENAELGVGEFRESSYDQRVYNSDLVTIGERTVIPANVKVGKNTAIWGKTAPEDYPDGKLQSGDAIVKAGVVK